MRHIVVLIGVAVICACGGRGGTGRDSGEDATDFGHGNVCGNGVIEWPETCDDGPANSDTRPDACRTGCVTAECGDGAVDSGEECDDGNASAGDGCSPTCTIECGNGVIDPGEECDGRLLGGQTCETLGLHAGTLACTPSCGFDTSGCPCGPADCPSDPTDGPIGTACHDDTDCEPGFECSDESVEVFDGERYINWRGGYCFTGGFGVAGCDPDVSDSCPTGSECTNLGDSLTTGETFYGCNDQCSAASPTGTPWTNNCDCREGYACRYGNPPPPPCYAGGPWGGDCPAPQEGIPRLVDSSGPFCVPGCSHDRECCEIWHDGEGGARDHGRQAGEVTLLGPDECADTCNTCTWECRRNGCPGGDCRVGDPCDHDSDCPAGAVCLDAFVSGIPGGMCTIPRCDHPGSECPIGSGCGEVLPEPVGRIACFVPCDPATHPGDADFACREGYACIPVAPSFWLDGTSAGGYCAPGNFPGGDAPLGATCSESAQCRSPDGLGMCKHYAYRPPHFCTIRCSEASAEVGSCGGADASGSATGACLTGEAQRGFFGGDSGFDAASTYLLGAGICLEACDTPAGTLGSNGCTEASMACVPLSQFGSDVHVASGSEPPAGLCHPPCRSDAECPLASPGTGVCDSGTGVCVVSP